MQELRSKKISSQTVTEQSVLTCEPLSLSMCKLLDASESMQIGVRLVCSMFCIIASSPSLVARSTDAAFTPVVLVYCLFVMRENEANKLVNFRHIIEYRRHTCP